MATGERCSGYSPATHSSASLRGAPGLQLRAGRWPRPCQEAEDSRMNCSHLCMAKVEQVSWSLMVLGPRCVFWSLDIFTLRELSRLLLGSGWAGQGSVVWYSLRECRRGWAGGSIRLPWGKHSPQRRLGRPNLPQQCPHCWHGWFVQNTAVLRKHNKRHSVPVSPVSPCQAAWF